MMLPLRLHWFCTKYSGVLEKLVNGLKVTNLYFKHYSICDFECKILTLAVGCSESIPGWNASLMSQSTD